MVRETAVLQYVGPPQKGGWEVVTQLPNGKPHRLVFNEANKFKVEVDLKLTYHDVRRNENLVLNDNYPLSLLDAYGPKSKDPVLKLVERKKHDALEVDPLEKFKAEKEPESVVELEKSKKEKKT